MMLSIFLVFVCVVGLIAPLWGVDMWIKRARIKRTPVRPSGMLELGTTAVRGRATTPTPTLAPFSGRPSAYCRWSHETKTVIREGRETSILLGSGGGAIVQPLFIDDGTGPLLVSTAASDVELEVPRNFTFTNEDGSGRVVRDTPQHILDFLLATGVSIADERGFMRGITVAEHCLEDGADVFALGRYSDELDDIERATVDHATVLRDIGMPRAVLTRQSPRRRCYVATGTDRQIPRRLFWRGLMCLVLGPMASAASAGLLFFIYYVLD